MFLALFDCAQYNSFMAYLSPTTLGKANYNSREIKTLIFCSSFSLVALIAIGGCHSPATQLAAEVRNAGGEASVLTNGVLVVNLSELRSSIDEKNFVEILDHIRVANQSFTLRLRGFDLNDQQLSKLAECGELLELDLSYCRISEGSLPRLSQLKKLRSLSLAFTRLPASDLEWISNVVTLERLELASTGANDMTVVKIATLPRLEYLYLNQTEVKDAGLSALPAIGALKDLGLGSLTGVTDKGIVALTRFRQLDSLDIAGTKVTPDGVNKLLESTAVRILFVGPVFMKDPQMRNLKTKYPRTSFQ
jgi:hypothetical protein